MKNPITNSYRAQIIRACIGVIKQLGPSVIKSAQRDEMVRVLEDMDTRLRAAVDKGEA